jgi:hypothetical protein
LFAVDIEHRNPVRLPLSVECVNFIILSVIKALYREILVVAINIDLNVLGYFLAVGVFAISIAVWMIEEMMVLFFLVMEQIHKNQIVIYEAACDERIWEVVNRHCMVV